MEIGRGDTGVIHRVGEYVYKLSQVSSVEINTPRSWLNVELAFGRFIRTVKRTKNIKGLITLDQSKSAIGLRKDLPAEILGNFPEKRNGAKPYIAMLVYPYLPGVNLGTLALENKLDRKMRIKCAIELLQIIGQFSHRFSHRDIALRNIMLSNGQIYLIDYSCMEEVKHAETVDYFHAIEALITNCLWPETAGKNYSMIRAVASLKKYGESVASTPMRKKSLEYMKRIKFDMWMLYFEESMLELLDMAVDFDEWAKHVGYYSAKIGGRNLRYFTTTEIVDLYALVTHMEIDKAIKYLKMMS